MLFCFFSSDYDENDGDDLVSPVKKSKKIINAKERSNCLCISRKRMRGKWLYTRKSKLERQRLEFERMERRKGEETSTKIGDG